MADMLVEAVNWSAEWKKKKSRNQVLSMPRTAHYIAGWPRDADLGVIAEANYAQKLYLSEGYQIVDSSDADSARWLRTLRKIASGPSNDPDDGRPGGLGMGAAGTTAGTRPGR